MCSKHTSKVKYTFKLLKSYQSLLRLQTWPLFPGETEIGGRGGHGQQGPPGPACVQEVSVRIPLSHARLSNSPQCIQLALSTDQNESLMNITPPGASGWARACHITWTYCRNSHAFLCRKQEAELMHCCYWDESDCFPSRHLAYLCNPARWLQERGNILPHLRMIYTSNAPISVSHLCFTVSILHVCFPDIFLPTDKYIFQVGTSYQCCNHSYLKSTLHCI